MCYFLFLGIISILIYFAIFYYFYFLGSVGSWDSAWSFLVCPFCKLRKGLGLMGQGCGFEPRWWRFSANVRMRNFISFYAFTHSR